MSFDEIVTSLLLLVAAYTFLWPRAQRPAVPARRHAQRAQPGPRRAQSTLRTSVQPVTSYGALAYVITAYCAVAVVIMRDIAQSCAGAWRDVLRPAQSSIKPVAQLPSPVAQLPRPTAQSTPAHKPAPVDDDDFADSRKRVAAWDYVAPPPVIASKEVKTASELPAELAKLAGTGNLELGTDTSETPETVGGKRKAAILAALDKGLTASQIADIMPIQRQRAFRIVAAVEAERMATLVNIKVSH